MKPVCFGFHFNQANKNRINWGEDLVLWSSFEFSCEKIATEGDCFCFSSDFGAKCTSSCYGIANASGQAA